MKVAIYTRVSTAEQNLNGFSIHEQRKNLFLSVKLMNGKNMKFSQTAVLVVVLPKDQHYRIYSID